MEREVLTLEDIDRLFMEMGEKAIEENAEPPKKMLNLDNMILDEEMELPDAEATENYFPY